MVKGENEMGKVAGYSDQRYPEGRSLLMFQYLVQIAVQIGVELSLSLLGFQT